MGCVTKDWDLGKRRLTAQEFILSLGLVLTPFLWWKTYDTREPKMAIALGLALILGLICFYKGEIKAFKNKWLLAFLAYIPLHLIFLPKIVLKGISIIPNFYIWKPMLFMAVFFLMLIAVVNMKTDKKLIPTVMVWCGFVMALYMIFQYFKIDQFYILKEWKFPITNPHISGTLGHPTIGSAFTAMLIPLALYLKKRIFAIIMGIATILTLSYVAIGAMVVSLFFYFFFTFKKTFLKWIIIGLFLIGLAGTSYIITRPGFNGDTGRFGMWKKVIEDVRLPVNERKETFPFTGRGMGSFEYLHRIKHQDNNAQAHNDYLELLSNGGYIGLFLFLMAILYLFKSNFPLTDPYRIGLLSSFLCVLIIAGGTFVFQLSPFNFYTITIAGLLTRGELCQ